MSRTGGRLLVLVGIVALAVNLRPAAVSVGPVLDDVRDGLGMSGTEAGVLTALPVVAFAVLGSLAPRLASLIGPHRLTALSLVAVAVGLAARSHVDGVPAFLLLSLLALGGMATANVVLPSLVKQHFPDRVGTITAVYSTALAVGITGSSVLTVPVGDAGDGWRDGLGVWALVAAVALLPWLALLRRDRGRTRTAAADRVPLAAVARTRTGRVLAAFFALQSLQAYAVFGWFAGIYRDHGFSAGTAGLLLGVITGTAVPLSFLVPSLAGRMRDVTALVLFLAACYPVGYLGLAFGPEASLGWAVVWAVLIGTGTATFPLVLVLIGLRSRTPEGTASLSAFTQSVGYLFSALGPFGFGVLHDVTGGWTVPLLALSLLSLPLALCGLAVSRPSYVEDELAELSPRSTGGGS